MAPQPLRHHQPHLPGMGPAQFGQPTPAPAPTPIPTPAMAQAPNTPIPQSTGATPPPKPPRTTRVKMVPNIPIAVAKGAGKGAGAAAGAVGTFIPSGIILTAGMGLVLVNSLKDGSLKSLWDTISNPKSSPDVKTQHQTFLKVFGEVLFVFVISYIAETSADASRAMLALIGALWFLWLMLNSQSAVSWVNSITTQFAPQQPGKKQ